MATSWDGTRRAFPTRVRRLILERDPVCVVCGDAPSTIADHHPSYADLERAGVRDPHAPRFGRGVCAPCHDVLTREQQRDGLQRMHARRVHPFARR